MVFFSNFFKKMFLFANFPIFSKVPFFSKVFHFKGFLFKTFFAMFFC